MAKTPIRVGPALVATGPATIYTAPAAGTVIRWVNVVNPSGSPVDFTLSVNTDSTSTRVYDGETIGIGGRLVDYPYLELGSTDTLEVSASTNNVLVLTVGGDELAAPGPSPGAARVLGPFPFAYNDAGLNDGIAFYTPAVGDILLDVWIVPTVSFDGMSPLADVGTFSGTNFGLWGNFAVSCVSLSSAADETGAGAGYLFSQNVNTATISAILAAETNTFGAVPGIFTSTAAWKIVVSQSGQKGGAAVGGTAGAGAVYLVVATPSLT